MKKLLINILEKISWQVDKVALKLHEEDINSCSKNFKTNRLDVFIDDQPDPASWNDLPEEEKERILKWSRFNEQYRLMSVFQEFVKDQELLTWEIKEERYVDDCLGDIFSREDMAVCEKLVITRIKYEE